MILEREMFSSCTEVMDLRCNRFILFFSKLLLRHLTSFVLSLLAGCKRILVYSICLEHISFVELIIRFTAV